MSKRYGQGVAEMYIQTSLFSTEKLQQQRKLLEELIELKAKEIHDKEFRNIYGNAEQLAITKEKVNKKISNFMRKVYKAFPDCF